MALRKIFYSTCSPYLFLIFVFIRRLACDHENVRPDLVILGKALSGGVLPVSFFFFFSFIEINIVIHASEVGL